MKAQWVELIKIVMQKNQKLIWIQKNLPLKVFKLEF